MIKTDIHKAIIDTAMDLISRVEFEKVTVDLVCQTAGIGRATFYNHFKNLEELVCEHFLLLGTLAAPQLGWVLSAPTAYEKILRIHLSYAGESEKPKRMVLYKVYLRSCLTHAGKKNLEGTDYIRQLLLPLIKQAQDNGEIANKTEIEQLCDTAMMLQWGNIFLWAMSDGAIDRTESFIKALEALYNPREDLKRGLYE